MSNQQLVAQYAAQRAAHYGQAQRAQYQPGAAVYGQAPPQQVCALAG